MSRAAPADRPSVAIIGYEARLPGAPTADAAWRVMLEGRSTVSEIPSDRWSAMQFVGVQGEIARSYTNAAGVLDEIWDFDAAYFGLSPREAEQMDPQQRILLEVTARAFDHAGIDPGSLDRARTGVFVGASANEHSHYALQSPEIVDSQFMLGNTASLIANRLSHQWNLNGPSLTIDTACSSGLVAVHQAVRAIESGEIDTALVAGVHLLLSPIAFVGFSRAGMLSPRGRCHAFAEGADGYVRAEGAVTFILQRADLARRLGLRTHSTVVATGINTGGRKTGIAMPSVERQTAMIASVAQAGQLDANDLVYAEAHGTGTAVGDPVEAEALGRVYGQARKAPLPIGSAKTNFGHLEPVAGLVGLLKAQMILTNGVIPPSLNAEVLNPDIDFARLNLAVVRDAMILPKAARRSVAVNSFGFGGANAHAVLAEPAKAQVPHAADMPPALMLSAQSPTALAALASDWSAVLADPSQPHAGLVANANWNRARLGHRLVLAAGSPAGLSDELARFLTGDHLDAAPEAALTGPRKIGFVFSGNGAAWEGMARHIYVGDRAFRRVFNALGEISLDLGGPDLAALLMTPLPEGALSQAAIVQPLHFAAQVALVAALAEAGLTPDACLGHSLGEVAAAVAAGRLSRDEGMRIVIARSRSFAALEGAGTMAVLATSWTEAEAMITESGGQVDIAADNAPGQLTLSGTEGDLRSVLTLARQRRIAGKVLSIPYPYHSRQVDRIEDDLRGSLTLIGGAADGTADFYSGCLGALHNGARLDADYWWLNARDPVRFRAGVEAMLAGGVGILVEITPASVLKGYLRDIAAARGASVRLIETLDRQRPTERSAAAIVGRVLMVGGAVDEAKVLGPRRPYLSQPPSAPFERVRYDLRPARGANVFARAPEHPLLGQRLEAASPVWQATLSLRHQPWLGDHRVHGRVILPAMAIVALFDAAASEVLCQRPELRDLAILRAVELPDDAGITIRTTWEPDAKSLRLEQQAGERWQTVARCRVFAAVSSSDDLPPVATTEADPYPRLKEIGLGYGPAFARLGGVSQTADGVLVDLSPTALPGLTPDPTALDAALHALILATGVVANDALVPVRLGRFERIGEGVVTRARLCIRSQRTDFVRVDVDFADAQGAVVARMRDLCLSRWSRPDDGAVTVWTETEAALPGQAAPVVADLIAPHLRAENGVPSDLDLIRAALGGRLAWDAALSGGDSAATARDWLVGAGWITPDADLAASPCPWPEADTLLAHLGGLSRDTSDELLPALAAAAGTGAPAIRHRHLAARLTAMLGGRDLPPNILMVGAVDAALIATLGPSALVTLGAAGPDGVRLAEDEFGASGPLRIADLDSPDLTGAFDLVIGIGIARSLPADTQARVFDCVTPGGEVLLAEELPDIFALMTGRQLRSDALDAIRQKAAGFDIDLKTHTLAGSEAYLVLAGRRAPFAMRQAKLDVHGSGPLADALRQLPEADAGHTASLLVTSAGALPAALRGMPPTDPLWVVVEGAGHSAECFAWRRALSNESGRDLRMVVVDADADVPELAGMLATASEHEIDLTQGAKTRRIVPRGIAPTTGDAMRLTTGARSLTLDGLGWQVASRTAPGEDEVEIEILATALNFRDVMWAQGLLPGEALDGGHTGAGLGMECAGRVLRSGKASGFQPGDQVLAFAPQAFATHATIPSRAAVTLPVGLDPVTAAATPVVFLTADYALGEVARLSEGETVLIHGATGGVGLAAVQIARSLGARIIATAGSAAKRRYLAALGLEHVFDSRSMDFAEQVRAVTGGRGVDVVLNALSGEAIERGIDCLAPFGRFVELGKRDIFENALIGLRGLRNNISLHVVDADQLLQHRPEVSRRIMKRVAEGLASGTLSPPPVMQFAAEDVRNAFRVMQRGEHIGKIVVTPPAVLKAADPVDLTGRWLVTGGTSGFGLASAEWLAGQGAGELWLVSRSGVVDAGVRERIEGLGVTLHVRAVDVTDRATLSAVLAEAGALDGVLHAAAVIEDATFAALDAAQIARVQGAKLGGARLLDELTRGSTLRHFWLYSSVASRLGNPGQSAYAAANAGLEDLARDRAARGLPALAVAWGPIGDAGVLIRDTTTADHLAARLGRLMTSAEAFVALGRALPGAAPGETLTIGRLDWSRLGDLPVVRGPLFSRLAIRTRAGGDLDLATLVATEGPATVRAKVVEVLIAEAAAVLRTRTSDLDPGQPLATYGFDSLMAMSLKTAVEDRLGCDVPLAGLTAELTLAGLAQAILGQFERGTPDDTLKNMAAIHLTETNLSEEQRVVIESAARKRA